MRQDGFSGPEATGIRNRGHLLLLYMLDPMWRHSRSTKRPSPISLLLSHSHMALFTCLKALDGDTGCGEREREAAEAEELVGETGGLVKVTRSCGRVVRGEGYVEE
jgi:hypothetical protein